ncbi:hypothetical protein D9M68_906900 [compost metagenome]
MHTKVTKIIPSDTELLVAGDAGVGGSISATNGNIQHNSLLMLSNGQFVAPDIQSAEEGFKYYVK